MAKKTRSNSSKNSHFHCIILSLIIATLAVSIFTLVNVYQLKNSLVPKKIDVNDFLAKLTSHDNMGGYVNIAPQNIIQINNNNLGNLQTQIEGLDLTYVGSFMVQYEDVIVIYDYDNDKIKGSVSLQQTQENN